LLWSLLRYLVFLIDSVRNLSLFHDLVFGLLRHFGLLLNNALLKAHNQATNGLTRVNLWHLLVLITIIIRLNVTIQIEGFCLLILPQATLTELVELWLSAYDLEYFRHV